MARISEFVLKDRLRIQWLTLMLVRIETEGGGEIRICLDN